MNAICFVFPHYERLHWDPIKDEPPSPEALTDITFDGPGCWALQTYCYLRLAGMNVVLSDRFIADHICVSHVDDLSTRDPPFRSYLVLVRADRPPVIAADHVIIQNDVELTPNYHHYVPLWTQAAINVRFVGRSNTVQRVAFLGRASNLAPDFHEPEFQRDLQAMGVSFVLKSAPDQWSDYSDIDLVLAVRDTQTHWLRTKPATKLYNAWHAGVPALLGPEPAFQSLRRSELDYCEVRTPDEALRAIQGLKANPSRYRAMIEHGHRRAQEFSVEAITERWRSVLEGPVQEGFERWRRFATVKRPYHLARFVVRAARERRARKKFLAL